MFTTSIAEDKVAINEYGEGYPGSNIHNSSNIRISSLPQQIREFASKLDIDGDGDLNHSDVAMALYHLETKKKENKNLRNIIVVFSVLSVLLVACIFGASMTAARLSQEVHVNAANGFAYVKGSGEVMKTERAMVWEQGGIAELPTKTLNRLAEIVLAEGDVRFKIKGSARSRDPLNDSVILLVEGGTLTWDRVEGLVDATGHAKTLLENTFGKDAFEVDVHVDGTNNSRRNLLNACYEPYFGYGGSY